MKSRLLRRVGILVVVALMVVGSTVIAQGPFGSRDDPWAQIHTKLDTIIAALTNESQPPTPGQVRLFTGFLFTQGGSTVTCTLVNLAITPLTVRVRVHGPAPIIRRDEELTLDEGEGLDIGASSGGFSRCEFSFIGFAEDVRANIQWHVPGSSTATVMEAR
jgi:hypothetical protein